MSFSFVPVGHTLDCDAVCVLNVAVLVNAENIVIGKLVAKLIKDIANIAVRNINNVGFAVSRN